MVQRRSGGRRERLALAALVLALALVPGGCARNPVSGRPEVVLVSAQREQAIGRDETTKLEEGVGFVGGPLAAYVDALGQRLALHSPRGGIEYHFHVVDMELPNAFALPGGYVFVTRGLLALVNSEDELAGVLGHEIGHVAARHSVQRVSLGAPFALAIGIPTRVAGVVPVVGPAVAGAGELATGLIMAPYARSQERQADQLGQDFAAAAGWDPAALASFLHTLSREEALQGDRRRPPAFLASHPSTPDRVRDTTRRAEGLERAAHAPIAAGRPAFLERLAGLRVGPDPAEGVFVETLFLHPELELRLRFPDGWETRNAEQFVAAREPGGAALAVLELAEGEDPLTAARAFAAGTRGWTHGEPVSLTIGGLPAARLASQRKDASLEVTWIAHGEQLFRIRGASEDPSGATHGATLRAVADSLGPLRPGERERILDMRLRIVPARADEEAAGFLERTGGAWSAEELVVANALEGPGPFGAGRLLKVPVGQPYRGGGHPAR